MLARSELTSHLCRRACSPRSSAAPDVAGVLTTGFASTQDEQTARTSGVGDVLSKPLTLAELCTVVARARLGEANGASASAPV